MQKEPRFSTVFKTRRGSRLSLLVLPLLFFATHSLSAQNDQTFGQRLWYGGSFNLGITGSQGVSAFGLGVAPMVGYKLFGPFSIGPRVSVNYTHFRVRLPNNQVATANPVAWGAGLFGRAKVTRNIFAHAEYELSEQAFMAFSSNDIQIFRRQHGNTYIGGGYNSGSEWGYEIMLLYNVTPPREDLQVPFTIRFGLTYRF
jgi:hypothetical protein